MRSNAPGGERAANHSRSTKCKINQKWHWVNNVAFAHHYSIPKV